MQITLIPVTPFEQNCSLIVCQETRKAAVVDPGGDLPIILEEVKKQGVTLEKILLTHGHIDHCAGSAALAEQCNIPIIGPHPDDQFWIDGLPEQSVKFGFPPAKAFIPQQWLKDGDKVTVGNLKLEVLHCPGHTPGHVVFYQPENRVAFVGDVLFAGSIGRTDFPRGNHAQLISSIRDKLWQLGNDVTFVPGHGPTSTFGEERKNNPYVADGVVI